MSKQECLSDEGPPPSCQYKVTNLQFDFDLDINILFLRKIACGHYRSNKHNRHNLYVDHLVLLHSESSAI